MGIKNQFVAYLASAGSGKTYALALRYIALLLKGEHPKTILAATFTKKAANEMRQRILHLLQELKSNEDFLGSLVQEYGFEREEILAKQKSMLNLFLTSRNHIVTLDSFFASILRSSALQISLDPNFAIEDSIHDNIDKALIQGIEKSGKMHALIALSLNLGKRKSRDLIALYNRLFQFNAMLTNREYISVDLTPFKQAIWQSKEEMLQLLIECKSNKSSIKNFSEESFDAFINKPLFSKETLSEHSHYKKAASAQPELEQLYVHLKQQIANYHAALEGNILHSLHELYESYKTIRLEEAKACNALDFDDVLYYTYRLLSSKISKDFLYFKLDTKFKHILLDEFQDTSALQFLILKPLIDEIFAGIGQSDFRSFFYVGDVKQSLYRFRGGAEELFSYVAKEYAIEMKTLDTNYRSSALVVQSVNEWFREKIEGYTSQIAHSKTQGYVEVAQTEELLEGTTKSVNALLEQGAILDEIAILVFANKDGIKMQEHLKQHGIESLLNTSSSLRSDPKIAALVGVLEYLLSGHKLFVEPFLQKCNIGYEALDFGWFRADMLPFVALEKIVSTFHYFGEDLNILKLLEFASKFKTIVRFLDEFKRSNIELAQRFKKGLSIMTIHKSKGLEFKYVIVLDRLGRRPPNRDMLLFKNKTPLQIERIFYKKRGKENFLREYQLAALSEKEMVQKDRLNLLYVALTRAELGLIVLVKPKASEFDLLELSIMKKGSIILAPKPKTKPLKPLNSTVTSYGKQELPASDEKEFGVKDYNAIYFGEALHYALELMDFKNLESVDTAVNAMQSRYGLLLEGKAIVSIRKRIEQLLQSNFLSLIAGGKIFKERALVYESKFYQLDLLVEFEDRSIIVDYKSSRKFAKKHFDQVGNYMQALRTFSKRLVKGYIVYLLEDEIVIEEAKESS